MGLKKCLFCVAEISEYAKSCPKCERTNPFDQRAKALVDETSALAQIERRVLSNTFRCPECLTEITYDYLLGYTRSHHLWDLKCDSCGYPKFFKGCEKCGAPATHYDARQEAFVCEEHLIERCSECGELIYKNKKVYRSGGCGAKTREAIHWECTHQYRRGRQMQVVVLLVIGVLVLLLAKCTSS